MALKLTTRVARKLSAMRTTKSGGRNGGRPQRLTTCPKCGAECTYRQLTRREHKC